MHLIRNKTPKTWPLDRKGTKYLVRPLNGIKRSLPVLIILREMLKIVKTRREAKALINLGKVKVNGKQVRDDKYSLDLFDILCLDDKNLRLVYKNKKFALEEVKSDNLEKVAKVIGKKVLKHGKLQVNLSDSRNYITNEKVKVGDSVVVDLKENKIKEVLNFKHGARVMFITGKHIGERGVIETVDEKTGLISIKTDKGKINAKLASLIVTN